MTENLFFKACKKGMLKLVVNCLQHGADPTTDYNFAIKCASKYGHVDVVEILEKHLTAPKN